MASRRNAALARAPDHRGLIDRIHATETAAWYRPEPEVLPVR
jgi:hypothetical protein